jgi:hypothetical protein
LALELVETQLARHSSMMHDMTNSSKDTDAVLKWSNVIMGLKLRLKQQLKQVLMSNGLEREMRHRLAGDATPDALVAARCMLKFEVKVSRDWAHDTLCLRHFSKRLSSQRVDWNEQFQTLLDLPEDTAEAKLKKYSSLSHVAKDFTYAAELCARVIINELSVPVPLKTIKPLTGMAGTAGGTKFQSCSIMFKLATDSHGLYGGIREAQKATGK